MKKTRFWLSLAAALTGGACITLGNPALASLPMIAPPASAGMTEEQQLTTALPPTPIAADHFDNGPCWEDETVVGSDCPWEDSYDEAWSYRYNAYENNYVERNEEPAVVEPEATDETPAVADTASEYDDYWEDDYYDESYYDYYDDELPAEETYTATDTEETATYQCEYGDDCYWNNDYYYYSDHDAEVVEAEEMSADEQSIDYWEDDYCDYGCECYADELQDEAAASGQPIATDDPMYDEYYTEYWEEDAYDYGDDSLGNKQSDETMVSEQAADSQDVADESEYGYDYEYGYESGYESEYDYGYESDYGYECDEAVVADESEEPSYDEDYADYWEDDYYDYQEEVYADEMAADEPVASDSDAESYGFEDAYGYEYDDQESMDDSTDVSDAGESWSYDYYGEESYGYEDSYYDEYGEYEYAAPQERYGSAESTAEMSDEALYDGYSEAYPYEEYAYPEYMSDDMSEAYSDDSMDDMGDEQFYGDDESSELVDDSWNAEDEYWEAYENEHMLRGDYNYEVLYGEVSDEVDPYDAPAEDEMFDDEEMDEFDSYDAVHENGADAEPEAAEQDLQGGFGLGVQRPADLLTFADQQIVQTLQQTAGDATRTRRARLAEHLEGLGWQAIDFAFRFEDVTGEEVLGLTEDLPAVAAFLAVFRQVERGELGMDEGVETLRRSLDDVTLDWIEGVDQITADAYQTWEDRQLAESDREQNDPTELSNLVVEAVMTAATDKLGEIGERILGLSQKLAELGWAPVAAEPVDDAAISQASAPEIPVTR